MEEDQESRHVCRFCSKRFPCGRSLGGHMRSHIANISSQTQPRLAATNLLPATVGYDLREKRKKTWRVADPFDDTLVFLNKFCKQCGKGFLSWKALFGHMKCHSDKERASNNKNYNSEDQDSWTIIDTHFENEAPSRRRRKTTTTSSSLPFPIPSSSVSEADELEQEEVAMSLMMLSRDVGPWGFQQMGSEKTAKRSELLASDRFPRSGFMMNKAKRLDSEEEDDDDDDDERLGKKNYKLLDSNYLKNCHKRGKFECSTCNKIFQSYQALGGHKASHKKNTKGCLASRDESSIETDVVEHEEGSGFDDDEEAESKKSKGHQCPVCLKIFASGQALGGHKRSHMGGSHSRKDQIAVLIQEPVQEIRDFIDLNLPAATEEESNNNSSHSECYRSPLWIVGSHKKETLVGLMSS